MRLLLQMLNRLFGFFFFLIIFLLGYLVLSCRKIKTHISTMKELGKDASAENLAKDYQVSDLGEAELTSGWVRDSRVKLSELLVLAA